MKTNLVSLIVFVSLVLSLQTGCEWAGRTTGKAVTVAKDVVETIKKAPDDFKEGYEDERGQEDTDIDQKENDQLSDKPEER